MIASIFFMCVSYASKYIAFFAVHAEIEPWSPAPCVTRRPTVTSQNLQDDQCADDREDPGDRRADRLVQHLAAVAVHQPERQHLAGASFSASLTALVAKTPVRIAPSVPPAPCTPKASSASS